MPRKICDTHEKGEDEMMLALEERQDHVGNEDDNSGKTVLNGEESAGAIRISSNCSS
jgi:hypothetical protein